MCHNVLGCYTLEHPTSQHGKDNKFIYIWQHASIYHSMAVCIIRSTVPGRSVADRGYRTGC